MHFFVMRRTLASQQSKKSFSNTKIFSLKMWHSEPQDRIQDPDPDPYIGSGYKTLWKMLDLDIMSTERIRNSEDTRKMT
jgi:hypothetical protein